MDTRCSQDQQLETFCCVCRLQNNHGKNQHWVMPITTVLQDLIMKCNQPFDNNSIINNVKNQQITNNLLQLSKDFKALSIQCEKLSNDILQSLQNYNQTLQQEVESFKILDLVKKINESENQQNLQQNLHQLKNLTMNNGNNLSIKRDMSKQFYIKVQASAEIYYQTMKEINKNVFDIIQQIQEYSIMQKGNSQSFNYSQEQNNSNQGKEINSYQYTQQGYIYTEQNQIQNNPAQINSQKLQFQQSKQYSNINFVQSNYKK